MTTRLKKKMVLFTIILSCSLSRNIVVMQCLHLNNIILNYLYKYKVNFVHHWQLQLRLFGRRVVSAQCYNYLYVKILTSHPFQIMCTSYTVSQAFSLAKMRLYKHSSGTCVVLKRSQRIPYQYHDFGVSIELKCVVINKTNYLRTSLRF